MEKKSEKLDIIRAGGHHSDNRLKKEKQFRTGILSTEWPTVNGDSQN